MQSRWPANVVASIRINGNRDNKRPDRNFTRLDAWTSKNRTQRPSQSIQSTFSSLSTVRQDSHKAATANKMPLDSMHRQEIIVKQPILSRTPRPSQSIQSTVSSLCASKWQAFVSTAIVITRDRKHRQVGTVK